jgi:hypothetical protein
MQKELGIANTERLRDLGGKLQIESGRTGAPVWAILSIAQLSSPRTGALNESMKRETRAPTIGFRFTLGVDGDQRRLASMKRSKACPNLRGRPECWVLVVVPFGLAHDAVNRLCPKMAGRRLLEHERDI